MLTKYIEWIKATSASRLGLKFIKSWLCNTVYYINTLLKVYAEESKVGITTRACLQCTNYFLVCRKKILQKSIKGTLPFLKISDMCGGTIVVLAAWSDL